MTQTLVDFKITISIQNSHFIITVGGCTLVCVNYLSASNVDRVFTLQNILSNALQRTTFYDYRSASAMMMLKIVRVKTLQNF